MSTSTRRTLAQKGAQVRLFNGKDQSGWVSLFENGSEWKVVDGIWRAVEVVQENPAFLVTERADFANFRLRIKYRYQEDGGGNRDPLFSRRENRSGYLIRHGVWPTTVGKQLPLAVSRKG